MFSSGFDKPMRKKDWSYRYYRKGRAEEDPRIDQHIEDHYKIYGQEKVNVSEMWKNDMKVLSNSGQTLEVDQLKKAYTEIELHPTLKSNLDRLNFSELTEVQSYIWELFGEEGNIIAKSFTGSGKTLSFLVPIINNMLVERFHWFKPEKGSSPTALIILPTRELCLQVFSECIKLLKDTGIQAEFLIGATRPDFYRISRGVDIIVATPGKLLDMMERELVRYNQLEYLVIDEADTMFDMGFKDDIKRVMKHPTIPDISKVKTVFTSATFTPEIMSLIEATSKKYYKIEPKEQNNITHNVKQEFFFTEGLGKIERMADLVNETEGQVIVFLNMKRAGPFLQKELSQVGIESIVFSSNLSQTERMVPF